MERIKNIQWYYDLRYVTNKNQMLRRENRKLVSNTPYTSIKLIHRVISGAFNSFLLIKL